MSASGPIDDRVRAVLKRKGLEEGGTLEAKRARLISNLLEAEGIPSNYGASTAGRCGKALAAAEA